jgi:zinc transport system substrate-binding protein
MKKKVWFNFFVIIILLLGLINLNGCKRTEINHNETKKPVIAVSIVPQKTFVEEVCGDLVEIVVMVPPGNSPANYEPTIQEMELFNQASL